MRMDVDSNVIHSDFIWVPSKFEQSPRLQENVRVMLLHQHSGSQRQPGEHHTLKYLVRRTLEVCSSRFLIEDASFALKNWVLKRLIFQSCSSLLHWPFDTFHLGGKAESFSGWKGNLQTWTASNLQAASGNPTVRDHLFKVWANCTRFIVDFEDQIKASWVWSDFQTNLQQSDMHFMSEYWYPWILVIGAVIDTIRNHKSSCVCVCASVCL